MGNTHVTPTSPATPPLMSFAVTLGREDEGDTELLEEAERHRSSEGGTQPEQVGVGDKKGRTGEQEQKEERVEQQLLWDPQLHTRDPSQPPTQQQHLSQPTWGSPPPPHPARPGPVTETGEGPGARRSGCPLQGHSPGLRHLVLTPPREMLL